MKALALVLNLVLVTAAYAGEREGGGADPCPGPDFSFACVITASEPQKNTVRVTATFSQSYQRHVFGTDGRYEVRFCPSVDKDKNWSMNVNLYNIFFDHRDIGHAGVNLIFPIEQKSFTARQYIQYKDTYENADISLECKNLKR